ncbi:MAG: GNAT family N-acetyltransferase [Alphaproteobacteria bacterium]|nr:MAG: hypothetical protein B6I23_02665 [Rickettsiaceae bacterium 4572_127]
MKKFSETLKGERIELRLLKPTFEIAQITFNEVDKNRDHLLPWMEWASKKETKTAEDTFKYLLEVSEKRKKGEHFDYGIFCKNKYLGNIGIFDIDKKEKSSEKGGWLKKEATGKGYMTEAVNLLLKEAFENVGLNRVQSRIDDKNLNSQKAIKRQGFTYEGILREAKFIKNENRWVNFMIFSILKSEWDERKKINNKQKRN